MLTDYLKNSLGTLIPAASGLIFSLIAGKALGLESYGVLVFVLASVDLIDKIVGVSTWQVFQKFQGEINEVKLIENVFTTDLIFGVISFVFTSIFLFILVVTNNAYNATYYLLLLISFSRIFDISIGFYRSEGKYGYLSTILSFGSLVKILLSITSLFLTNSLLIIILAISCEKIVTIILKYYSVKKLKPKLNFSFSKDYKSYLFNLYVDSTLRVLPRRLDVVFLNFLVAKEFLGAYQILKELTTLANYFVDPYYQISFRRIKAMSTHDALKYVRKNTLKFAYFAPFLFFMLLVPVYYFTDYFYIINIDNKLFILGVLLAPSVVAFITVLYAPYCLVIKTSKILRQVQVRSIAVYLFVMGYGLISYNYWFIISGNLIYYLIWAIYLRKRIYV